MNGKQLKEWAATVYDDAIISVKGKYAVRFEEDFFLRADFSTEISSKANMEDDDEFHL